MFTFCKAKWKETLEKLENWLNDNDAQPEMAKAIVSSLQAWNETKPFLTVRTDNTFLKEAIKQQERPCGRLLFWARKHNTD